MIIGYHISSIVWYLTPFFKFAALKTKKNSKEVWSKACSIETILKTVLSVYKIRLKKIIPMGSQPQKFCSPTLFVWLTLMLADSRYANKYSLYFFSISLEIVGWIKIRLHNDFETSLQPWELRVYMHAFLWERC